MKRIMFLLLLTSVALYSMAANAQHFSDWSAPVNLGPPVDLLVVDGKPIIDYQATVSKDGLTMYFVSNRPGGFGAADIWISHRASVDAPWEEPQNAGPSINTSCIEGGPLLTIDGHQLFFSRNNCPDGFGGNDLYVARRHNKRDDSGWAPAVNLGPTINTAAVEFGPAYFEDEGTGVITLYFHSTRPGSAGGTDIYASTLQPDGGWGEPQLVAELSSAFNDQAPSIRRDGLEIFLTSDRPGSLGGEGLDIFVSTRSSTSEPWSEPVSLGPVVNSVYSEIRPMVSFDATTLYFGSSRPGPSGAQNFDLWVSTRTKVNGHGHD